MTASPPFRPMAGINSCFVQQSLSRSFCQSTQSPGVSTQSPAAASQL